ncbi:MAG: hypothetical protein JXK94_11920 [Deltaproteobacteria bacterium]|nr:hypothetical protein [Deltaproteobacteria bacterium]
MSKFNFFSKKGSRPIIPFTDIVRDKLVLLALAGGKLSSEILKDNGARDVLVLDSKGNREAERHETYVRKRFSRIPDIRKNNCNVFVLHGIAVLGLMQKRQFARCGYILVPFGWPWFAAARLALLRYGKRNILSFVGSTDINCNGKVFRYVVLAANVRMPDQSRQYGPTGCTPLEILRRLSGLNYVVLRSIEQIENGSHRGDLDILVHHQDLENIKTRLESEIGTYPIDVYTDNGQFGHCYKSVPYFTFKLAKGLLDSAYETDKGLRVAKGDWNFLAFCYHLLFHDKSETLEANSNAINSRTFSKSSYHAELERLANIAGRPVPRTFEEMEGELRRAGVMPSLDLIGFYSNKNAFLKHRYFDHTRVKAGLATFFLRDFGSGIKKVPILRERLLEHFEILAEGPVDEKNRDSVIKGVRGGNWADSSAPGGVAEPVYWFVCWDSSPQQPSPRTRRKHPRVDNERIRLKDELRHELCESEKKGKRIIHSSDNSFEALDHLEHLGLTDHPEIAKRLFSGN